MFICLLLQPKILKSVSQCPGKYSQQPIRGEPQHTPGALPDRQQPEGELRCSVGWTPEPADPSHCLQPVALFPGQVCYYWLSMSTSESDNLCSTCLAHCIVLCVFSKLSKLELLEELNLSGNQLKAIPSTVSSCKRLHTLIAHSNHITVFPEILNLPEIKVRLPLVLFAWPVCVLLCSAWVSSIVFCTCVARRSKL